MSPTRAQSISPTRLHAQEGTSHRRLYLRPAFSPTRPSLRSPTVSKSPSHFFCKSPESLEDSFPGVTSKPTLCSYSFMVSLCHLRKCFASSKIFINLSSKLVYHFHPKISFSALSLESSSVTTAEPGCQEVGKLDLDAIVATICSCGGNDEAFKRLSVSEGWEYNNFQLSHEFVDKLLHRFEDDWKSAMITFRWVGSRPGYRHTNEAYDTMVDILGKAKKMDLLMAFLEEMRPKNIVTHKTISKVMRRFAGAGKWEDAVRIFDALSTFGLEKNAETMNILLDTLCKESKVEQARRIFLQLKLHISPAAETFNIFIHGWCKANRVDEACWTIQEMKGHGCRPCVISYSTIIHFYCRRHKFSRVYELLDEMEAEGCSPNVVTYSTVMSYLSKSEEYEAALRIADRLKSAGCKPDTMFYNCLIHTLGRAGRVQDAVHVFEVEMPKVGIYPNTVTYNTVIAMFCHHSQERKALHLLKSMENIQLCKPDLQTYYPLLKGCFRVGSSDSLLSELLSDMVHKHHLSLDISTYSLLVHGLCRANRCEWAYSLFQEMIVKDITPRYQTCCLLSELLKQNCMYDAADWIKSFMKKS